MKDGVKQLVPYYPYYSDYVPEDMVHVYRKLLPYFESTSNCKTSGLSSYWKGKEKRSIKMKDDYEALKRRDQEEDILLKIGQKMRELKMKQIEDNIQSQEILVEGLKKKYSSMWVDEEGVEKKLDMGMKLAVETDPSKPEEEDPFAKVPTSMATYRNFEDVMDEKFRRLMGDFGDLTVERRRLAWGGKKLKTGDEQDGMAGKGGFIGYSSGYRYRTRRAPRHGTIGYNVDSYYDVYVDDYFDEDIEPAPEVAPVEAAPSIPVEQPVDPNLFAQDFIDQVPAIVDPVTTFKEEEFKHLEWDKDVAVYEDTYEPPEPPAEPMAEPSLTAEQGCYVTVGANGTLLASDGAIFQILANGTLKSAAGAVFAPTGVLLSAANELVNADLGFEGAVALADGVKLDEGRMFVIKEQHLGEGEMLLSFLGGAEFVDGAGRLFRRGRSQQPGMAPAAMKSMKAGGKPMTKTALAQTIADGVAVLDSLHGVAASELKKAGKFTIPGVCMVKTRQKPATKAGKREAFGKVMMVKAKPAKTVVKAFCVAALKKEF